MTAQLREHIRSCLEQAAPRLGRALDHLDWPSSGGGAPAEANALINLMYYLQNLPQPFDIYAEGTSSGGRIDMMAFDGETALAVEAKSFGAIHPQSESALRDLERMRVFKPAQTADLAEGQKRREWWSNAKERWGIILLSSFRGSEIADAWCNPDEAAFEPIMSSYTNPKERAQRNDAGEPEGFFKLYKSFESQNRGAALVTKGERWKGCGQGWFLWGAVPLPA